MRQRPRKKPTRAAIEEERDSLRQALEDIADILEDLGIIDSGEDDDTPDGPVIQGEYVSDDEANAEKKDDPERQDPSTT